MKRGLILVFLFCIPFVVAHDKPDFNFQFYNGVTHWSVEVTENAGACGEVHEITKVYPVAIHNNGQTATIDDYGHGALRGKFTAPFTLHFDQMTVPDSGGQSDLEEHDIQISRDCTSFVASYYWTYYDQYQRCTGSTGLKGTRTDGTNCPQYGVSLATPHPVVQPPQSPVQTKEQELLNVLSRDPANFWANWDLAELRKKQGDYDAYALYFSNAVSNPSIYDTTQRILKKQALADLKLKQEPSPDTSPLLRTESVQAKTDGAMFSPDALAKPTTPDGWKILKEMIKDTFFKDVKKRSYHDAAIDAANPNQ